MSSELRIKCFLGDEGAGEGVLRSLRALEPVTKGLRGAVAQSRTRHDLSALLEQLDADCGDYLIKVVIHQRSPQLDNVVPIRRLAPEQGGTEAEQEAVLHAELATG